MGKNKDDKEEAAVEVTEEVVEAKAVETETKEAEAEVSEDTQILTDEMKAALEENEAEEIADAKIQAGINEAAEAFKVEQEINNTGDEIAEKIEPNVIPVQAAPQVAAGERREVPQNNQRSSEKENKKMANNIREEAEIKTVYVKEKQRTGWWKIVMLILTILITITFMATALFAGLGAWQLHKIEQNQAEAQIAVPQQPEPYYGNGGGNSQYGQGGYYDDYDYYDGYGYGADNDDDLSLQDILDLYGDDIEDILNNAGSNNGGGNGNSSGSGSFSDWFSDLFGTDDSSTGNTYGF